MANQPRVESLEATYRGNKTSVPRGPLPGTVARGQFWADEAFATGKAAGQFATVLPPSLAEELAGGKLLPRGQERFGVFCAHCHGQVGGGHGGDAAMLSKVGMVVKRGFPVPPTYHQPRLRDAPIGQIFDVISHGVGRMQAHDYLIPIEDRWAIAAYVKALQLSQFAPREMLGTEDLNQLRAPAP